MAWTKAKMGIAVAAGLLFALGTAAVVVKYAGQSNRNSQEQEAQSIVDRLGSKYFNLLSYSSTGVTKEEVDGKTLTGTFSIRLGRTNLYLVEYDFQGAGLTNKGAAWCDGSGDYFANDLVENLPKQTGSSVLNTNKVFKVPSHGLANNPGSLWGVSGGATLVVPAMFFATQIPDETAAGKLAWLYDERKWSAARMMKEPNETVDGIDCLVVSAETDEGKAWLWIGQQDFLLHQSRQSLKAKVTDITLAEVMAMLNATLTKPSLSVKEIQQRINSARKKASVTMRPIKITFSTLSGESGLKSMTINPPGVFVFTQTHRNIVVNQKFSPGDFTR